MFDQGICEHIVRLAYEYNFEMPGLKKKSLTLRQRFRKKMQITTCVESDTDNDLDFNEIQNDPVRSDAVIPSESLVPTVDENEIILPIIKKQRGRPRKIVTALRESPVQNNSQKKQIITKFVSRK